MKAPVWLPAIAYQAQVLYSETRKEKDPVKALEVLLRLINDEKMGGVWKRLYQKSQLDKGSGRYQYAGIVSPKSRAADLRRRAFQLLKSDKPENRKEAAYLFFEADVTAKMKDWGADPRWSEQDRAVQWFFYHIYKNAIDYKPMIRSDLEDIRTRLRKIAEQLRRLAETMKSLGLQADAAELENVVTTCESKAKSIVPSRNDDPWVFERKLGDERLRTFVIHTCGAAKILFGQNLYGTVATIANVVFDPNVAVGAARVREVIRASTELRDHK